MRLIPLTQGYFAKVDDEDYEWLSKYQWHVSGFSKKYGYKYAVRKRSTKIKTGSRCIWMHRLIVNPPTGFDTDHINGDKLDNRRSNLRICSRAENNMNRSVGRHNKSGYRGVSTNKENKFIAVISKNNKKYYLGYFDTAKEAAIAYNKASLKYHGEFAKPNIID